MNVLDAIKNRHSAKNFDPNYIISSDIKKNLLEICLENAPSAFNLQHWRLVLIEDQKQRAQIREFSWNQPQVTESSMLVVITAHKNSWQNKVAQRVWSGATQDVQSFMMSAIDQYYHGRLEVQRDELMRSAGIFSQTLMLAAQEFGLDSCSMVGFDFGKMAEVIHLPNDHVICLMVAIGKSTTQRYPKIGKLPFDEVIKINSF
ncbi:hypothetical protein P256_02353 [Acinetobacter nectaris CIP 110549]|uniref:Nitroreductase domain-containing protein n=1 Tax=Acinetobacter nectaris CIP 110549 TaxID=1392540 RepID=V2T4I3_9GAMM|nr:nitroreductase family protein [Acinetobacter nectaris]ESK37298.1 hypothetical protein P256_02353 [Acinetobacter nectaris CIP 110549]